MEPTTVQQICRELEAERVRQGLTYYVVAQRAGKNGQIGVMRLLKGEYRAPSLAEVASVAEALGKKIVLAKR